MPRTVRGKTDEWTTPRSLFDQLDKEFHFTLDPCSTDDNALCAHHYTAVDDGLQQNWGGETVFVNPPFSTIGQWVEKCYREGCKDHTTVVLVIPSRTETQYFHRFINHRCEIRFIEGRLHYGNSKMNAPFSSMICIFRGAYV